MTSSSKCRLTRNCPSLPLRAGTRSSFQLIADSRWLIVFCCCCSFLFFFVYFPCHCHSHSYPLLFRASLLRCCATERHNGHVTFSLSFSLWSFWSRHWSDPSIKPYQSPPTLFHFRSVRSFVSFSLFFFLFLLCCRWVLTWTEAGTEAAATAHVCTVMVLYSTLLLLRSLPSSWWWCLPPCTHTRTVHCQLQTFVTHALYVFYWTLWVPFFSFSPSALVSLWAAFCSI